MPASKRTMSLAQQYQEPFWYSAAYLHERLPVPPDNASPALLPEQMTRAAKRLERWRESFGSEASLYEQWLEQTALSEQELLHLLAENEQSLALRLDGFPAWLGSFLEALDQDESMTPLSEDFLLTLVKMPFPKPEHIDNRILLIAVEPWLRQAHARLSNDLLHLRERAPDLLPESASIVLSLLSTLAVQFLQMSERALILEFRLAQRMEQRFSGSTAQEQLCSYARTLRNRQNRLAFFAEYPVLARQITQVVEQWHASHLEMLTRLVGDWPAIKALFWPDQLPGALQQVQSQAGDRHHGGRSVQLLSFASGVGLVYKPRSLAVDLHFQEFLQWLNMHDQEPSMRVLRVLDRGEYGWMERVEIDAHGCYSTEELERFYLRQGANLALLYALNATDFHHENILAAGEDPVLIDLEALFHTQITPAQTSFSVAEQQVYEQAMTSVLRTHLLPSHVLVGEEDTWLEIGGLGGTPGQLLPNRILRLGGQEANELRFMRESATTSGSQNRPRLCGEDVDARIYLPQVIEGFTRTYRLLLHRRQGLLAEDGPLTHFQNDRVRTVLRPTSAYAQILFACGHPYVLRDDLDRERLLNHLWQVVPQQPYMAAVITSEQAELRQGNVPSFTTRVNLRDLWTSSGERLPAFFAQSGFAAMQERLQHLSEQDLARQIWFIRASFTALSSETDHFTDFSQTSEQPVQETVPLVSREELLAAASQIGDRLCQLAVLKDNNASWLELAQPDQQHWTLNVADLTLYDGLPGIVLALAYLGKITGSERYTETARAGAVTLRKQIERQGSTLTSVGFFSGWGGVITALTHLAVLWEDESLLAEASQLVTKLPPLIEQDEALDLVSGSAGCALALCGLARVAPSSEIDVALRLCGEHLVASAVTLPEGVGWIAFKEVPPLSGLAHGSAGFAWALLEIARNTGEQCFLDLAQATLAYERSLFSPDDRNWRDLRHASASPMTAWCHGAAGIGLSRLHMLSAFEDEVLHAEIQAALETTLARGFGANHSLCHGDLGNLEVLFQAQRVLSEPRWQAAYELRKASIFARGQHVGWQCGTPQQVETPGLMLGLAGIGLQLLRLAEPQRVPSLLSMDCLVPSNL